MCWYTVQLENVAVLVFIDDASVSGFGAMVKNIRGVEVRSTNCCTFLSWSSYTLFTLLFSWVGGLGQGGAIHVIRMIIEQSLLFVASAGADGIIEFSSS